MMNTKKIDKLFDHTIRSKDVYKGVLYIEDAEGNISYSRNNGESDLDTPLVMASTTKLFTTVCIFRLVGDGKLKLDTPITQYFDEESMRGLHIYRAKEYTSEMTIKHLVCQTSGLPDFYLEGQDPFFKKVMKEDIGYTFEEELCWVKQLKSHFEPGKQGKANYLM